MPNQASKPDEGPPLCGQGHPWRSMILDTETPEGKVFKCPSCGRTIIQRPPGVPDERRPH